MNGTISPVVDVTIGGQTRVYHAFITTAPATLDGPSTLTLYESNFADVAGFAANPIPFDRALGRTARAAGAHWSTDLEWQRSALSRRPVPARANRSDSRRTNELAALAVASPRRAVHRRGALMGATHRKDTKQRKRRTPPAG